MLHLQMLPDRRIIAVEGCGRYIGNQVTGILHHSTNMADYCCGDGLGIGEVVQALIDFEQDHQCQLLGWSTRMRANEGRIGGRWRVDLAQLFDGGRARKTGIGSSLNRGHTSLLSCPPKFLSSP